MLGIGAATAAAHIGNNFATYLIGGLIDRYGFTPVAMGAWNMAETLSYACAMFLITPFVSMLNPRRLAILAGLIVIVAQALGALTGSYPLLLLTRIGTGIGFGLANTALNLAAAGTRHPARAISIGITCQTILYAGINLGLPLVGEAAGVTGMFAALAGLSALLTLGATLLPSHGGTLSDQPVRLRTGSHGARVLVAMALFTFGSLMIWPFMERAAHAIGLSAVEFGRFQSVATLASAFGNVILAATVGRIRQDIAVGVALLLCGVACAALTTVANHALFATALVAYNVAWFVSYPLLLGIAYRVSSDGSLAILCSAVWLLMMSLGSLATGFIAQTLGGYGAVGPLGLGFCILAALSAASLARPVAVNPLKAPPSSAG